MPIQTTSQRYRNLQFKGGMVPQYSAPSDTTVLAWLKPLYESSTDLGGGVFLGETPNGGASDIISQLVGLGVRSIGSSPGYGAVRISALQKGSAHYTRMAAQWTAAQALSQEYGSTFRVPCVHWMQAESDQGLIARADYVTALGTLASDIAADTLALTGTAAKLITYQIGGVANEVYATYATTSLSQAFIDADDADTSTIALAMYPFDYADLYHLTGRSSNIVGAYFGLAALRLGMPTLKNGAANPYYDPTWKCLKPLSVAIDGGDVVVTFNVPMGSLAFDASLVTAAANMGFQVLDTSLVPVAISAVTIDGDTVRITTTAAPPVGGSVQYACEDWVNTTGRTTGPRGNLRDTQGSSIRFTSCSGEVIPLHNWCVRFRKEIA